MVVLEYFDVVGDCLYVGDVVVDEDDVEVEFV